MLRTNLGRFKIVFAPFSCISKRPSFSPNFLTGFQVLNLKIHELKRNTLPTTNCDPKVARPNRF